MINFSYRRYGLKFRQIFFVKEELKEMNSSDICLIHGVDEFNKEIINLSSNPNVITREQNSLINNLESNEEEMLNKVKKNYRYEIRRAEKEGVTRKFISGNSIVRGNEYFETFINTYNEMFKAKKLNNRFNTNLFLAGAQNNCAFITVACHNEEPLVFHAYLHDFNNVILIYSASNTFNDDKEKANLIGRMNKWLHWNDMCLFKSRGIKRYDWGGVRSFSDPNGIDIFKMSFGGNPIVYKNFIYGKSALGSIGIKAYLWRSTNKND